MSALAWGKPKRYPFRVIALDRFGQQDCGRFEHFEDAAKLCEDLLPFSASVYAWNPVKQEWHRTYENGKGI
jgi:hypothetical protein